MKKIFIFITCILLISCWNNTKIDNVEKNKTKLDSSIYNIEELKSIFINKDIIKSENLAQTIEDEKNIIKWLWFNIYRLWIINYDFYGSVNWYNKISISLQWDREDIEYDIYLNKFWDIKISKNNINYTEPKWQEGSKVDIINEFKCSILSNNCSSDILFLINYLDENKLLIIK
jgi:hypothetical protein